MKDGERGTYEFLCGRWLSQSEDDGQISRDLILAGGDGLEFTPGWGLIILA